MSNCHFTEAEAENGRFFEYKNSKRMCVGIACIAIIIVLIFYFFVVQNPNNPVTGTWKRIGPFEGAHEDIYTGWVCSFNQSGKFKLYLCRTGGEFILQEEKEYIVLGNKIDFPTDTSPVPIKFSLQGGVLELTYDYSAYSGAGNFQIMKFQRLSIYEEICGGYR